MYLEINLLPKGLRPRKTLIRLDYKFLAFVVIVLAAAVVGWYYFYLGTQMNTLAERKQALLAQQVKMQGQVELDKQVKELEATMKERIGIIRTLTGDSDRRLAMLIHINKVLPKNLWLENIMEATVGGVIEFTIEGMSYSKDDISRLLEGLEEFDQFASVNLESITPAPMNIRDAFRFIVRVRLTPSASSPPPEEKNVGNKVAASNN